MSARRLRRDVHRSLHRYCRRRRRSHPSGGHPGVYATRRAPPVDPEWRLAGMPSMEETPGGLSLVVRENYPSERSIPGSTESRRSPRFSALSRRGRIDATKPDPQEQKEQTPLPVPRTRKRSRRPRRVDRRPAVAAVLRRRPGGTRPPGARDLDGLARARRRPGAGRPGGWRGRIGSDSARGIRTPPRRAEAPAEHDPCGRPVSRGGGTRRGRAPDPGPGRAHPGAR